MFVRSRQRIAEKCQYWQSDDGDGLNGRDSLRLAESLQKEIDTGRTANYTRRYMSELEAMPNQYYQRPMRRHRHAQAGTGAAPAIPWKRGS
jgi:hypothetical protein